MDRAGKDLLARSALAALRGRFEQPAIVAAFFGIRRGELCLSEVMTIMVGFHLSGYRTFKPYYLNYMLRYQRGYFPGLVSYNRFVELALT